MGRFEEDRSEVMAKEMVYRYAESALISAVRLRRYWISQGFSEEEAVRRALKQAVGMLASSGVKPERLLELFYELRDACNAFIRGLEYVEVKKA
jgi:type IV pilus biogenesis protein CpaD/CtpE